VDEFTREALAIRVGRSCTADDVVEVIAGLVAERGAPTYLRSDNGPEFVAWALRDYCRMTLMATSYIEPGSPWENPFVESFNGRLRDELPNIEEFGSITEASVVIEDWATGIQPPPKHGAWVNHPPRHHAEPTISQLPFRRYRQSAATWHRSNIFVTFEGSSFFVITGA
jgi:putative transposase